MAPLVGRRGARGSLGFRGRGKGASGDAQKNRFYSNRIEDSNEEPSKTLSDLEDKSDGDVGSSSESSDGSVEDGRAAVKPYSALLQSLTSHVSSNSKPARKKRKLSEGGPVSVDKGHANGQQKAALNENVAIVDEAEEEVDPLYPQSSETEDLDDNDKDDDEVHDVTDPFESHLSGFDEESIARSVEIVRNSMWTSHKSVTKDGFRAVFTGPTEKDGKSVEHQLKLRSTDQMRLKQRLKTRADNMLSQIEGLYEDFAGAIFNYRDVLFGERTAQNAERVRLLTTLHAINHVTKTRDRIIKNSVKLAKAESEDVEFRDQGFTRPKILFILPTRQSCAKAVESIVSLYEPEQQENKKRFQDAFSQHDEGTFQDKPEDFRDLFFGNDDDMFRIGMKFTRKTIKLFTQFYGSDIIFASPLGLRMALGVEGSKKQDHDFLSSIEVLIIDHCDALLMQNWEHVEYALDHLNLQPKEAHGCDFGRVRNWYLDGHAKHLRQTILTSSFNTPEINKLFTRGISNIEGKVKLSHDSYGGTISELGIQLRQTFSRFESVAPSSDPDARFKTFTTTIVPTLDKSSRGSSGHGLGVMVFIPSYLDFVRIRNFLAVSQSAQNISFGSISEYTSHKETSRARSHFITGRHSVLLYTGRAHHFNRFRIRGCKKVIFYSLPDNPIFYKEIAGEFLSKSISEGIVDPNDAASRVLFSKWDALKLERIVGTDRVGSMMKEKGGDTFDFL